MQNKTRTCQRLMILFLTRQDQMFSFWCYFGPYGSISGEHISYSGNSFFSTGHTLYILTLQPITLSIKDKDHGSSIHTLREISTISLPRELRELSFFTGWGHLFVGELEFFGVIRGGLVFLCMQRGTRKNCRPVITNRRPPGKK